MNEIKYDWFQTENSIIIDILLENLSSEDVDIFFDEQKVNFKSKKENKCLNISLYSQIFPSQSEIKFFPSKVELKLAKNDKSLHRWPTLEEKINQPSPSHTPNTINTYPSSHSKGPKNWDKIEKDIEIEEQNTKLEGEGALAQLFQKIYSDGSDDVKKAMNKSFVNNLHLIL